MYEQIIAWFGLSLLVVFCLPFTGVRKLVLMVYAWALRLALLALLGAAACLWFRPEYLPDAVSDALNQSPWLGAILPKPGTPNFGIGAAAIVVGVLLPWLVVLDVCRKSAAVSQRRLEIYSTEPEAKEPVLQSPTTQREPHPALRRIDGRAAADAMAEAGSRKPSRTINRLEK